MAIISAGYPRISPERPASINAIQWAQMAAHLGADYWVGGGFSITTVSGADRTLQLSAQALGGRGVQDELDAPETAQLDPIASGSRWDTLCLRRNWTDAESALVAIRGGTSRTISRTYTEPGAMDDQPLALAQLQATPGGATITSIRPVAPRVGPGGMIADYPEAMQYLDQPGGRLYVISDGTEYHRILNASGNATWQPVLSQEVGTVAVRDTNSHLWQRPLRFTRTGDDVSLYFNLLRRQGTDIVGDATSWVYTLPSRLRPIYDGNFYFELRSYRDGPGTTGFTFSIGAGGQVRIHNTNPSWHIGPNTTYHGSISYQAAN